MFAGCMVAEIHYDEYKAVWPTTARDFLTVRVRRRPLSHHHWSRECMLMRRNHDAMAEMVNLYCVRGLAMCMDAQCLS